MPYTWYIPGTWVVNIWYNIRYRWYVQDKNLQKKLWLRNGILTQQFCLNCSICEYTYVSYPNNITF